MSNYLTNPILYKKITNVNNFSGNKSYSQNYSYFPVMNQNNQVQQSYMLNGLGKTNYVKPNESKTDIYNMSLVYPTQRGL